MGNRPSSRAQGTHVAEILQSPSTKDEAKIAGGYTLNIFDNASNYHISQYSYRRRRRYLIPRLHDQAGLRSWLDELLC